MPTAKTESRPITETAKENPRDIKISPAIPGRITLPAGLENNLESLEENQVFLLAVHRQIPNALSANQILFSSYPKVLAKDGKISLELDYFAVQTGFFNDKYIIQADFDGTRTLVEIKIIKTGYD
jgi:hypothetical protein